MHKAEVESSPDVVGTICDFSQVFFNKIDAKNSYCACNNLWHYDWQISHFEKYWGDSFGGLADNMCMVHFIHMWKEPFKIFIK